MDVDDFAKELNFKMSDQKFGNGHSHDHSNIGNNIVLIGVMASGKTTVGWQLARLMGYGFIDIDREIERSQKKDIAKIFESDGEQKFREIESGFIQDLKSLRNHVLSTGGGAVLDDENWATLTQLGTIIWLNPSSVEIAHRLLSHPAGLLGRPLLADLAEVVPKDTRFKSLKDRIDALVRQRKDRYKLAQLVIEDSFTTPELTAFRIRDLVRDGGETAQ